MKIKEALEIGYACGLSRVGECLNNISIHSSQLFKFDEITDELQELYADFKTKDYDEYTSITDVLDKATMARIDNQFYGR